MKERFLSYAQNYEDLIIYHVLKDVNRGFYVDVGANDPWDDSVTKAFYEHGWNGINIEPLRDEFIELEADRKRDINCNVGAGKEDGMLDFVVNGGLSSCDSRIIEKSDSGSELISIPVKRLTDIITGSSQTDTEIHFCKIDVEGLEKSVLEGLDFSVIRPWVFAIEATIPGTNLACHGEWEYILLDAGYVFALQFGVNRYYVDCNKIALKDRFLTPRVLKTHYDVYKCVKSVRSEVLSGDKLIYNTISAASNIILYGGGNGCKEILDLFQVVNLELPDSIWDLNAAYVGSVGGVRAVMPLFSDEREKYSDTIFIITLMDNAVSNKISAELTRTVSPKKIFRFGETLSALESVYHNEILCATDASSP